LFSNSCLVFNVDYYKFAVHDVRTYTLIQYTCKHNEDDTPKQKSFLIHYSNTF